jgi:hypothetical protein
MLLSIKYCFKNITPEIAWTRSKLFDAGRAGKILHSQFAAVPLCQIEKCLKKKERKKLGRAALSGSTAL